MDIKAKGIWGVVAAIGLVAYGWWSYTNVTSHLDEIRAPILQQLEGEYYSQTLPDVAHADQFEVLEVTIAEIDARGVFDDKQVIRVKPLVNGGPPPDGETYRYFTSSYSSLFGWKLPTPALAYQFDRKWF